MIKLHKGLYLHPLVLILFPFSYIFGFFYELSLAFIAAFCHEGAHLLTALCLKEKCTAAIIMPYGLKLVLKSSRSLFNELLITASGPFFNLMMLLLFKSGPFREMNLSMLIINLLPVMPCDGGRMLYLLFSSESPFFAESVMQKISFVSSVFLFALGIFQALLTGFNLSLFIIGVFLLSSCIDTKRRTRLYLKSTLSVSPPPDSLRREKTLAAPEKLTVRSIFPRLSPFSYNTVDVISPDGKLLFSVTETVLFNEIKKRGASITLSELKKEYSRQS